MEDSNANTHHKRRSRDGNLELEKKCRSEHGGHLKRAASTGRRPETRTKNWKEPLPSSKTRSFPVRRVHELSTAALSAESRLNEERRENDHNRQMLVKVELMFQAFPSDPFPPAVPHAAHRGPKGSGIPWIMRSPRKEEVTLGGLQDPGSHADAVLYCIANGEIKWKVHWTKYLSGILTLLVPSLCILPGLVISALYVKGEGQEGAHVTKFDSAGYFKQQPSYRLERAIQSEGGKSTCFRDIEVHLELKLFVGDSDRIKTSVQEKYNDSDEGDYKLARKGRKQNHKGRTASNNRSSDPPEGWWYSLLLMADKIE
ncbi:hypothetical protein HPG69_016662 [Diceros bicornis minor]|uniref:Uncharacterized protein n=1 Tax=Diceros bicornis minor TaxID=77932 RepID=A0A7J7FNI1_DICBM|nr:hypothetical protein HPG69_016662 [Diceros bicornis minor]